MIYGIGTDMIEVGRVATLYEKAAVMEKIFTLLEREYISSRGKGAMETAAGIFAAKEAVSKALGTGLGALGLLNIEICHYGTGKPYVKLVNREIDNKIVHITISHTKEYATAFAVCETI